MTEPSVSELEAALTRHASATGEVYPSSLALIDAEEHWSGRLWQVTHLVMSDQETMRYLAGGNRPDEVASCVARWSDSDLGLDDMKTIFSAGGYDPEPFEVLARSGLVRSSLLLDDGRPRLVRGERAGTWISDTFALSTEADILEGVEHELAPQARQI